MYCSHCGQPVSDGAAVCVHCGFAVNRPATPAVAEPDAPSFGFAVLGFFVPLVGLILYLVYESKQPKKAKSAGKGALIGFIVGVVLSILLTVLYIIGFSALFFEISETFTDVYFS